MAVNYKFGMRIDDAIAFFKSAIHAFTSNLKGNFENHGF